MFTDLQITDVDGHRILWIESHRLNDYRDAYLAGSFTTLGINTAKGYAVSNIEFIADWTFVRDIFIVPGVVDISLRPLASLRSLRSLIVSGSECTDITLAEFPELEEFRGYWHPKLLCDSHRLRVLDLSRYKSKTGDLVHFPSLPALQELQLVQGNTASLVGVDRLPALSIVELHHLSKLVSLRGVDLLPQLERLHCGNCPSLKDAAVVAPALRSLRVLRLNDCAPLSSLHFLDRMTNLEEFRFVGTNVADGDMTPLLQLKRVGFMRKRGFSHTPEEINSLIAASSAPS